jgi:DNA-binding IclR family transcriptional regulator
MPQKRKFKLDNFLEVLAIKYGLSTGVIARKLKCHISTALRYLRELKRAKQVVEQRVSNTINL